MDLINSLLTQAIEQSAVPAEKQKWLVSQIGWLIAWEEALANSPVLSAQRDDLLCRIQAADSNLPGQLYDCEADECAGYSMVLETLLMWVIQNHQHDSGVMPHLTNITCVLGVLLVMQERLAGFDQPEWPR